MSVKKCVAVLFAVCLFSTGFALTASAADQTCNKLVIDQITSDSVLAVPIAKLFFTTGSSCSDATVFTSDSDQKVKFKLPATGQDQMLAVLLTAFSLDKTVWISFDDTGSQPLDLLVVALNK